MFRIGHGWRLRAARDIPVSAIRDFIRPAIHAVPPNMVRQLGHCRVSLVWNLDSPSVGSRWTWNDAGIGISLSPRAHAGHDIALELLLCLGQALWEGLPYSRRKAWWLLLDDEIRTGVTGEIDEDALKEKRLLQSNRYSAASARRLERYGSASFAGTAAEYVHSLWHDVRVRRGARFLPAEQLRRRLDLLARWFPPGRGYLLFPPSSRDGRRKVPATRVAVRN